MIRGIQRQMIMVKTDKSSIFESACFLLRHDLTEPSANSSDMICEANRIIEENYSSKKGKRTPKSKRIKDHIPAFLTGCLSGALLLGAIFTLCALK